MLGGAAFSGDYEVVRVGEEAQADYRVGRVQNFGEEGIGYTLWAEGEEREVRLNIPGAHNALNSALAIAACRKLGVTIDQALQGLARLQLTGKRLAVKEKNGITVIDDTYNAAPDSMRSVIDTLMYTGGRRRIAILGGMNGLGEDSPRYHREVGEYAGGQALDLLITVGEKAADIARGCSAVRGQECVMHFDRKEDLYPLIGSLFREGDVVAVKGSRLMEMEKVVAEILKEQE